MNWTITLTITVTNEETARRLARAFDLTNESNVLDDLMGDDMHQHTLGGERDGEKALHLLIPLDDDKMYNDPSVREPLPTYESDAIELMPGDGMYAVAFRAEHTEDGDHQWPTQEEMQAAQDEYLALVESGEIKTGPDGER